ncbi:ABC transporter permease [Agromyces sp. NPDC049794]|uniref:ABC transporter permease n=1 Tax=unclassified Agromyces TaxID=2639701 RepID=UPI0033C594A9
MTTTLEDPVILPVRPARSARSQRARLGRRIGFALAVGWIALLLVLAAIADLLPMPAIDEPVGPPSVPPFSGDGPLLGTDAIGRDMGSRLIHGIRISMAVGVGATAIAIVIGVLLGLIAAYARGVVESVVNVLTDTVLSFPPLLLLMALATVVTPGVPTLVFALGALFVPPFVRLTRASVLGQLGRDYITAARSLGAGHLRILFRELLPNSIQPIISYSVVVIALIIVIEGSLSFLGVGVPAPAPSWGSMIASGKDNLARAPYLVIAPSLMIFLTVFAFNTVGDQLRRRISTGSEA